MQLFVIPVTSHFVYRDSQAREVEFPLAVKAHIPVLPILQEDIPNRDFSRTCGSLQTLSRYVSLSDPTVIPYKEKLRKVLQSVLVGDVLAERVRAAFDAYVFLSYRKKDRAQAQRLMQLIHENELCRDIAIWYDEFLVPGEDFNEAILEALVKCSVFSLVVTPQLLEEPNYVLREEYPFALGEQKPILPVEMEATDPVELARLYGAAGSPLSGNDRERIGAALVKMLRGIALRENDSDPTHNYLIGLAYLSGIDVEKDHWRALELIASAAEAGLLEACRRLVSIHSYEPIPGLQHDFHEAIRWEHQIIEIILNDDTVPPECKASTLVEEYGELASLWTALGDERAADANSEMIKWAERLYQLNGSEAERRLVDSYAVVAKHHIFDGNSDIARHLLNKALRVCTHEVWQGDSASLYKAQITVHTLLGDASGKHDPYDSIEHYLKALAVYKQARELLDERALLETEMELSMCLGDTYRHIGEIHEARVWYERAADTLPSLTIRSSLDDKWLIDTLYSTLGSICHEEGDAKGAVRWYKECVSHLESVYARSARTDDGVSLANTKRRLGDCYRDLDDKEQAHHYYRECLSLIGSLQAGNSSLALLESAALAHYREGSLDFLPRAERLSHMESAHLTGMRLREATSKSIYDGLISASGQAIDALS